MDPGTMVAAVRSALAGLIGVSPSARQRAEIRRDAQLFKTLKDQHLDTASAKLELLINLEVDRLYDRRVKSFGRSFAWSTLFAGSIILIAPGVGAWLLYPPHGALQVTAFVLITAVGGLLMIGTIGAFFTARSNNGSDGAERAT